MQRVHRRYGNRADEQLSDLDRQIVLRLQADGRRPSTQIAAELRMSEAAVRVRANRLIGDGVVQIVGIADPQRMGHERLALIGVKL